MSWPRRLTRPLHRLGPNRAASHRIGLLRLLLRRAAHRYATHDWPVIPGARLTGDRFDCGDPACRTESCHPLPGSEATGSSDPQRIALWWQNTEHGVLLATGHSFDVLEVAGAAGWHVARQVCGPVAVAPPQRWMFLVRPGGVLCDELNGHPSVVLHRKGSWIPAPPTPLPTGPVRWQTPPAQYDWRLPNPYEVQRETLRALRYGHRRSVDQQPRAEWRHTNAPAHTAE